MPRKVYGCYLPNGTCCVDLIRGSDGVREDINEGTYSNADEYLNETLHDLYLSGEGMNGGKPIETENLKDYLHLHSSILFCTRCSFTQRDHNCQRFRRTYKRRLYY